ncbi:branched-chain amino acid ABC transporter permease [Frigidibacter sp. MR17.14]|uniref:branched-chain amino acid ABC transporter permease n=1 Tax=Frigidibacter sp. MR17.14 TaxID=3126509 RepID=UPI003012CFD8
MRDFALPAALIAVLWAATMVLPAYHEGNLARIMLLATYAMGYNIAFGYTGLLSLGHALFFGAGMYAAGLAAEYGGVPAGPGLALGLLGGGAMALAVGLLALRTTGVSFLIVTMMFAQAGYLTILYYTPVTRGEEGIVLASALRRIGPLDLSADDTRYLVALAIFAAGLVVQAALVRSRFGRVMVAMRENEERSRMLGYSPYRVKLIALVISGLYAGLAGAAYGLLFGYVGAGFAAIQNSIAPLLWVLLGGAGTVLGPFLGTAAMFYLTDLASTITTATLMVTGVALLILVLFAPKGVLGTIRDRWAPWLP